MRFHPVGVCRFVSASIVATLAGVTLPSVSRAEPPEGKPMVIRLGDGGKLEKAAFLGLTTSPAQPVLRKQLQLQAGMGLVVDFVAEKSPAADAGLKQFDVVQKIDDQILVNPQQLAVLVRSHKVGDEVKLSIIRDGKPQTMTVKLAEKELPPLEEMRFTDDDRFDRLVPAPMPPGAIGENGPRIRIPAPGQDWPRLMTESMTMVRDDGKTRLTLTTRNGQKHLEAKDKEGKVLFDGPVDTKEQKEKVPADIRDQLDKMTSMSGATLNLTIETEPGKRPAKPTTQKAD